MKLICDTELFTNTKELPKEYLFLKLRMYLNKELFDTKIISYDTYDKMQSFLTREMDKIVVKYR